MVKPSTDPHMYKTKKFHTIYYVGYFWLFFSFPLCSVWLKNCWSWATELFSWPTNGLWSAVGKDIVGICSSDSQETDFISNSVLIPKCLVMALPEVQTGVSITTYTHNRIEVKGERRLFKHYSILTVPGQYRVLAWSRGKWKMVICDVWQFTKE